jgi:hypothetical protein
MSIVRFSDALHREAMRLVRTQTNAVNLATTGDQTLLTLSGQRGVLNSLGIRFTTGLTGTPTFTITVTIDGGAAFIFSLITGGLSLDADAAAFQRAGDLGPVSGNEVLGLGFGGIPFNTSCLVVLNRTAAGSAGVGNFTVVHQVPA